jgi:hypothetical protein
MVDGRWTLSRSGEPQPPPHREPITSRSFQLITDNGKVNNRHPVRIRFLVTTGNICGDYGVLTIL